MDSLFVNSFIGYNLLVTPKSTLMVLSWPLVDVERTMKYLSCPTHTFLAEVEQDDVLPSSFSSYTMNMFTFRNIFSATFILRFFKK